MKPNTAVPTFLCRQFVGMTLELTVLLARGHQPIGTLEFVGSVDGNSSLVKSLQLGLLCGQFAVW